MENLKVTPITEIIKKKKSKNIYNDIKDFLSMHYEFRFNEVTFDHEYKPINDSKWGRIDDKLENDLLMELNDNNIEAKNVDLSTVIKSSYSTPYNPILDYFNNLKTVEDDRVLEEFYEFITGKSSDDSNEFKQFESWFCFHASLSMGHEPTGLYCLCFFGKQGTGKTSLFKHLTPDYLSYLAKDNFTDYESKDAKIEISDNFLILLDELGQSSKHELTKLKSLITQKQVKERRPYSRRAVVTPRRAGFIGTFDTKEIFSDTAGNRRFIVIEIRKIDWNKIKKFPVDSIWASAKRRVLDNSYCKHIDDLNSETAKNFEKQSFEFDLLTKWFRNSNKNEFYTATEIKNHLIERESNSIDEIYSNNTDTDIKAKNLDMVKKSIKINDRLLGDSLRKMFDRVARRRGSSSVYGYMCEKLTSPEETKSDIQTDDDVF